MDKEIREGLLKSLFILSDTIGRILECDGDNCEGCEDETLCDIRDFIREKKEDEQEVRFK